MSNAGVSADTCLRGDAFCRQPNPSHVPSRAGGRAGTGSAAPRAAHLLVPPAIQGQPKLGACETCWQRPQRSRDSWLGLDQLRRRSGRSQASQRRNIPAHLDRNRKGAPSPPRSNGQAFDEARNSVTVAGRRRCRASTPVRPCWDPAYPCCSPLTGWASRPLAASSYRSEGGRVRPGSADWP